MLTSHALDAITDPFVECVHRVHDRLVLLSQRRVDTFDQLLHQLMEFGNLRSLFWQVTKVRSSQLSIELLQVSHIITDGLVFVRHTYLAASLLGDVKRDFGR